MKKINNFYPGLRESWMLFGVFIVSSIIGATPMSLIKSISPMWESWSFFVGYILSFVLVYAFILIYTYNTHDGDVTSPDFSKTRVNIYVFLILLFIVPCLSILSEFFISWIPVPEWFESVMKNAVKMNFASFLTVVVAAPILEEWLCRGIILRGLLRQGSPWRAIVWSAAIFAIMHLNPWQAVPAFVLGILFGWIYWKTRSLWLCIFMHVVNNGFSFLLMFLYPGAMDTKDAAGNFYTLILLVSLLLIFVLGYILYKGIEYNKNNTTV